MEKRIGDLLWSIALPGLAQLLNQRYIKGLALIFLEVIINVQAKINLAIIPSFHGDFQLAVELADYQWILFYPCLYMFGMWDAYHDAGGKDIPFSFFPFVFGAFLGTIGVIYSSHILGPIFLPIIFIILGVGLGFIIKILLTKETPKS